MPAWLLVLAAVASIASLAVAVGAVVMVIRLQWRVEDLADTVGLLTEPPQSPLPVSPGESWRNNVL